MKLFIVFMQKNGVDFEKYVISDLANNAIAVAIFANPGSNVQGYRQIPVLS